MEFSSQRREVLLFLATNMAALTSRAINDLNSSVYFCIRLYPVTGVYLIRKNSLFYQLLLISSSCHTENN